MAIDPDKLQQALGKAMFDSREASGMTQLQLAAIVEVNQSTISNIENGKIWPEANTLARIANALGTSVYLLFEEAEKRTGEPLGREGAQVGRKWQNAPPHEREAFVVLLDRNRLRPPPESSPNETRAPSEA